MAAFAGSDAALDICVGLRRASQGYNRGRRNSGLLVAWCGVCEAVNRRDRLPFQRRRRRWPSGSCR
eukprot:2954356-Lingulodinium_polyedra.AAC.1